MRKNDMQDEQLDDEDEQQGEAVVDDRDQQIEELNNKYKRALADYQNLEKRVADQRREWMLSANRELLNRLLPVLDTMMMAAKHTQDSGISLTIDQFLQVLKQEGITKIETVGKAFDPFLMEAIATGDGKDGEVIEELRSGYLLHEKVLRPAQVRVGQEDKQ